MEKQEQRKPLPRQEMLWHASGAEAVTAKQKQRRGNIAVAVKQKSRKVVAAVKQKGRRADAAAKSRQNSFSWILLLLMIF